MERGVYFDGWYKNNHCYHPSLPMRSMQMVEDLERYHGTILVWSVLGGGSISLPYLEHEAFGEVDPRLRFYGFLNDSEFIAECKKRGIKPFGIVFEVQGWEFPVKLSEDGKHLKAFNVDRDGSCDSWYGLREFSQDKHTELFGKKFADYYPEGLYNSDGERVENLWEECAARTMYGTPVHTEWVEVKNHPHIAYQMCRNNPVWRDYLKKIIRIQIDAGVPGIQLDECELPMSSIRYGGCFCKDCMKQFNSYMNGLKAEGKLPDDVREIDFDTFDYAAYLRERVTAYPGNVKDLPLYHYYWDYQMGAVKKHFTELAEYAREYGRTKGENILVSGNFFNILPVYYTIREEADVIITEQAQSILREVAWYRYVAGFAGDKPVIVAENPYGSEINNYVHLWEEGRCYDLFLQLMMEGNVYGCNMSVPYGSWMGNEDKDAFWPPRELMTEIQDYIYENDALFSKNSGARVLVLYNLASNYWRETVAGYSSNSILESEDGGTLSFGIQDADDPGSVRLPFWEIVRELAAKQVNFDVEFMPDGRWHEDDFDEKKLRPYDLVILPDCFEITEKQAEILRAYADQAGKLLLYGCNGENIPGWQEEMLQKDSVSACSLKATRAESVAAFEKVFASIYDSLWEIQADSDQVNFGVHVLENGLAVHIINYAFDDAEGCTVPIRELRLTLRGKLAAYRGFRVKTVRDQKDLKAEIQEEDGEVHIIIHNMPTYCALYWDSLK